MQYKFLLQNLLQNDFAVENHFDPWNVTSGGA